MRTIPVNAGCGKDPKRLERAQKSTHFRYPIWTPKSTYSVPKRGSGAPASRYITDAHIGLFGDPFAFGATTYFFSKIQM